MFHPFCGVDSLEDYEARRGREPIVIDMEMIERGESPLFMSVYDRLYVTNKKRKPIETKSDAEIVDNIFKEKLEKKKPVVEKQKGLAAFQKKKEPVIKDELETSNASENISDNSDRQFIISLFK